ncbi:MAG TPA: class I poly(R)-hydroxyalkanoic acid synthase [Burkholderiaceae bacterium]|nr:class I poly(R)-hydroxyalkanoic acid synthase [Burkholderiaceae bacterium]
MAANETSDGQWWADLLRSQQALLGPFSVDGLGQALQPWTKAAYALSEWQQETVKQMMSFWPMSLAAAIPGFPPALNISSDRRFSADAWARDPRFDIMAKAYLAQVQNMRQALDAAPMDERTKSQWGFLLRQVVDAASPANCLLTNPEALQTAFDTAGRSLIEGAKLFIEDFAKGRVSMTDETAFEVGKNVALSPGSVIFENDLIQLIQYTPSTSRVHAAPLLIVPPCINKYYILDLQPENSLVAYAVSQGHTVFLISWRNIDASLGHLTWDDYIQQGVVRAMDVAREIVQSERINALGFCIGGSLLACTQGVLTAKGEDKLASLTLLTTLLDFTDTGELGLMVTPQSLSMREMAIGRGGVLHGRELAHMFAALRANDLIWPYVVNGYLQGKAPPPFDLLYWNADDSNLPGPMACWFMRNGYLENRIRQPGGGTVQCGVEVDLSRVTVPAFVYASREDHIVPWKTAYATTQILGGNISFVLGASGHIAGVINPPAKKKRSHWVDGHDGGSRRLAPDPDQWFANAEQRPGSWWPVWSEWLGRYSGPEVAAREKLGNEVYKPIEPAPGRYVKAKAT